MNLYSMLLKDRQFKNNQLGIGHIMCKSIDNKGTQVNIITLTGMIDRKTISTTMNTY